MIPGRKANPQQEFDEQWVAGGGSMRENPGERKIIGGAEPAMPDLRQKATS